VDSERVTAEAVLAGMLAQAEVDSEVRRVVLERRRERKAAAKLARAKILKPAAPRYRRKA
jgi:hypothetical protein